MVASMATLQKPLRVAIKSRALARAPQEFCLSFLLVCKNAAKLRGATFGTPETRTVLFVALNRSHLCGFIEGVAILGEAGKSLRLCRRVSVEVGEVVTLAAALATLGIERHFALAGRCNGGEGGAGTAARARRVKF
jgi:hypothetical protein